MKLNLQVISRETIKPSSATPPHPTTFNLSLIDQNMPHHYIPFVLFYSSNNNHKDDNQLNLAQRLDQLKTSLSETLTLYYPLAGRIKDNSIISCDDDTGVQVLISQVINCPLSKIINQPDPENLLLFVPWDQRDEQALLIVQLNVFECGGIAVGVCISHKVADASSVCTFLNTWASVNARVSSPNHEVLRPILDCASHFPPREIPLQMQIAETKEEERLVTKRYVFDASMIASLKAKATNRSSPSRVMAVMGFLWRVAMGPKFRPSNFGFAVNLRRRMDPPLSPLWFGNLATITMASVMKTTDQSAINYEILVEKLKGAVGRIDCDYVRKLKIGDEFTKVIDSVGELKEMFAKGELELYLTSSWCGFPFFEVDFGWGKPEWVNFPNFHDKNFFVLIDTRCGEGIEAWVTLGEEDMARFQCQPELLALLGSN